MQTSLILLSIEDKSFAITL